jgi:hypothetical protein
MAKKKQANGTSKAAKNTIAVLPKPNQPRPDPAADDRPFSVRCPEYEKAVRVRKVSADGKEYQVEFPPNSGELHAISAAGCARTK